MYFITQKFSETGSYRMSVKLTSASMLYKDAVIGFKNNPVKYYKQKTSIYPHLKELFIKAIKINGNDLIEYETARAVTKAYYKTRANKSGVYEPEVVAKAIADFALMYNLSKNIHTKGFRLPDFSDLSDIVDFIADILKKVIKVGIVTGIAAGAILIIGGLLLVPETSAAWPQVFGSISEMTQYVDYRKAIALTQSFKIMTGSAILLGSSILLPIGLKVTSKVWNAIKEAMYVFGFMEKNRIAKMIIHNTETYQKFEKAMKLLKKHEGKEIIPLKDAEKIQEFMGDVGVESENFLRDLDKLKGAFKKAKTELDKREKNNAS